MKQVGFHNKLQAPSLWLMQAKGVRKQFLVLDGESVLAFVAKKSDQNNAVKFSQCSSFRFSLSSRMIGSHLSYCRDITHDVGCKPVEGAAGLSLNSTAPAPAPAPPGLDLDLESSPGEIDTNLTLQLFIFHILLPMHRLHPWPPSDEKVKVKARKCFSLRLSSKSGSISAHLFRRSDSCYHILETLD